MKVDATHVELLHVLVPLTYITCPIPFSDRVSSCILGITKALWYLGAASFFSSRYTAMVWKSPRVPTKNLYPAKVN